MKIYLAGKMAPRTWRHELVDGMDEAQAAFDPTVDTHWPVLYDAICGYDYVGPYYSDTHGLEKSVIRTVIGRCALNAVRRADLVIAWVDSYSAYGTMVEVGYARALGKTILVGFDRRRDTGVDETFEDAMWLAGEAADLVIRPKDKGPVESVSSILTLYREHQIARDAEVTALKEQVGRIVTKMDGSDG